MRGGSTSGRGAPRCSRIAPRSCTSTGFLEFHHVVPYAAGGATTADNLELRCAAHNRYEAEQYFGESFAMFAREERVTNAEWAERVVRQ